MAAPRLGTKRLTAASKATASNAAPVLKDFEAATCRFDRDEHARSLPLLINRASASAYASVVESSKARAFDHSYRDVRKRRLMWCTPTPS